MGCLRKVYDNSFRQPLLEDLNGKTLSLRGRVDELDASQGQIESLQLKDNIAIQFRSSVRGIVSGPADIRKPYAELA